MRLLAFRKRLICNISERGIIEIMTKKWFLLKVLYIFIVFWGSVTCNEKTVLANEYTIVDENAGYNFFGFCYTVSGEELFG